MRRLFIAVVALLTAVSCFKEESYNSTLIFRAAQQLESNGDFTQLDDVVVYAYAADTLEYAPQSFEEALSGVVTNKITGATLSPIAEAEPYEGYFSYVYESEAEEGEESDEPYEDGEVVETLITGVALQAEMAEIMLVAVDPLNEGYAYCNYSVGLNLPTTYITLSFRPWRGGGFSQGFWWYVTPEVEVEEPTTPDEGTTTPDEGTTTPDEEGSVTPEE